MPASPQSITEPKPFKDPVRSAAAKRRWARARANGEVPLTFHCNITLSEEDAKALIASAAALGVNRSEVTRRALRAFNANVAAQNGNGNGTPP